MTSTHASSPQLICAHPTDALGVLHFSGTFNQASGWVFSDIADIARTYTTFILGLFVHIWLILWTFLIFQDIYPSTRAVCFRYFRHSQDMYYMWYIYFGYFGHSAAHLFLHFLLMLQKFYLFFRTFSQAPGLFFFRIFQTLSGHVLHLTYLFQTFWTFSTSFICACSRPEVPHSFRTFTQGPGLFFFFGYSGYSQDKYRIWYIYFGYFRHSAAHLNVHTLLMLRKFHIFSGHLSEHQGCFYFR